MRGGSPKLVGRDPDPATAATTPAAGLAPFVQNVVNNVCPPPIPNCQASYPGLFPGGAPVPIFSYACDNSLRPPPTISCPSAPTADNSPANIQEANITLIVAAPLPDASTGQARLVILNGRGRGI